MSDAVLHDRTTIALLERLGLSRNEIRCYLAALALRGAVVREIAAHAHVHRVNAYAAIRSLIERGLVHQELVGRSRHILAAPLTRLEEIALDAQKQATRLRWRIADRIPELAARLSQAGVLTEGGFADVIYLRGPDAFYRVADRTLNARPGSTICLLESFDYFIGIPDNPTYDEDEYIPRRLERRIAARVLHHHDAYAERLRANDAMEHRETRYLPEGIQFPCSIYTYGDEVAFLWTTQHINALVVRGGPLVELMRRVFDMVWEAAGHDRAKPTHESARLSVSTRRRRVR